MLRFAANMIRNISTPTPRRPNPACSGADRQRLADAALTMRLLIEGGAPSPMGDRAGGELAWRSGAPRRQPAY